MSRLLALLALVPALWACPASTPTPPAGGEKQKQLLESVGSRVILPTLRTFAERADALRAATAAHEAALGTATATTTREAAREAFRAAMLVWQEAEVLQVGPAGSTTARVMGAADLRDEIYSWPTVNPCRIDQELVANQFGADGFFGGALVNVKGLDAIEYALFHDGPGNACPPQVAINQGPWAALAPAELARRRAAYAAAAARHLQATAATLRDRWEPSGGDFLAQLTKPGEGGSTYSSAQVALDEVFRAAFYLDLETKDMKLALPAGISPDCPGATCPEQVESPWADLGKENVAANLRGVAKLFHGGDEGDPEAFGFFDLLGALGAGDLATEMESHLDEAEAKAAAIPGTLRGALAADVGAVEASHAAVKAFTDDLKGRFATVLNLRVPDEGAADND